MSTHSRYNKQHALTSSLFSGMQLLGFDMHIAELKAKIALNVNTFAKPNTKAFELVIHFLLSKLDADRANTVFCQCWPAVLPEQQKEFKEAVFVWLTELSSANKASQQQKSKHFNLLQHIKVPPITKSLLVSPTGLKVCELLFALVQYVVLSRLLRLIDTEKSHLRVWPKVSLELKQPFSAHTPSSNQIPLSKNLGQKYANLKLQLDMQYDSLRRQMDLQMDEMNQVTMRNLHIKAKLHDYSA